MIVDCTTRGCRNLEWRCKDCNRVVNVATFGDGWKRVEDGYPPLGKKVFGVDMNAEYPNIDELMYLGNDEGYHDWSSYGAQTYTPTHWMPYPELPNE